MKLLEDRIRKDGIVREGNILKVDSFVNHQIDCTFIAELAKEFKRLYAGEEITKILTIEASGIGIACIVALEFGVPVVFAKKTKTVNIANDVFTSKVTDPADPGCGRDHCRRGHRHRKSLSARRSDDPRYGRESRIARAHQVYER